MGRIGRVVLVVLATLVPVAATADPAEDVAKAVDRWAATFNANDVDALVKLYTPDAVLVGTANGRREFNKQAGLDVTFATLRATGRWPCTKFGLVAMNLSIHSQPYFCTMR